MPCIETYQKVDLRTITLGVPPQEVFFQMHKLLLDLMLQVLTKDSVTVSVDAVVSPLLLFVIGRISTF